ncbi:hypothetical protein EAH75_04245 [Rhodanobacter glycinis]|uniref:hypothetical protein n=1 Tax=Rhodanobacter glycinis TaxID=582702 RepID=UPI001125CE14|nr:hypothetical protein [Rhodanobacter glycinis]TPG50655.1 hypothetical protein EAH75_04245 [Rhodanobacter glycinis]
MSKRKILSAMKRKGIQVERISYEWEPTPGESVPAWNIQLSAEVADSFGELEFNQFDSLRDVLEWVDGLAPYTEPLAT